MDERDRLPAFMFVILSFGMIGFILSILLIVEVSKILLF